MIDKICARLKCSKPFQTNSKSKLYCSELCKGNNTQANARIRFLKKIHYYFGNKCALCGFDDPRALQIDHVAGGGRAERRTGIYGNVGTNLQYYRIVLREIESGKYQLLCANCNWIKRHTNFEK